MRSLFIVRLNLLLYFPRSGFLARRPEIFSFLLARLSASKRFFNVLKSRSAPASSTSTKTIVLVVIASFSVRLYSMNSGVHKPKRQFVPNEVKFLERWRADMSRYLSKKKAERDYTVVLHSRDEASMRYL